MSIDEAVSEAVRKAVVEVLKGIRLPEHSEARDELLSRGRAAKVADVSTSTIDRWLKDGTLTRRGKGRAPRVSRQELLAIRPAKSERTADDVMSELLGKRKR